MGQFDQTGRQIAKLDGAALLAWALSCCTRPPRLTFLSWDDTRRLVAPGEPDRTNDLVAQVRDEGRPGRPTWLIAEIEGEAEPGVFWRMGHYEVALGKEVNPTCDPDGPAVCSLVVNLSGTQKRRGVKAPFHGYGTAISPLVVDAAAQDAMRTLRRVEKGDLALTVLPFLALMKGAGEPAFIRRWMRAVEGEPDEARRLSYKDWAVIMAERAGREVDWLKETEGWMERKSKIIEGWLAEGREEGELHRLRATLLRFIQARWQQPAPEAIRLAVEGTADLAVLDRWVDAAATARSIAALRREMKLTE